MRRSDRFNDAKGKNTGLKLQILKELLDDMLSGNFDFDGRVPEFAIGEVKEDIKRLEDNE